MKRINSLEKLIRSRLILISFPLLLALMFLIDKSVHLLVDEIVINRLKQDAESLISALEKKEEQWTIKEEYLSGVYQRVNSGHYFILEWEEGQKRSRSLWDKAIQTDEFFAGDTHDYLYYESNDELWVIFKQEFSLNNVGFTLWIAEDISEIDQKQAYYEYLLIAITFLSILLFVFWQSYVLRNAFGKLIPIQKAINDNQLGEELVFPDNIPDEIKGLVGSINSLVKSSSSQLSRSRMALGNLAHELKKPIQELKIYAGQLTDEEVRTQMDHCISILQQRIDSELRKARISGAPMPGVFFNFSEELPYLKKLLNNVHDRDIDLVVTLEKEQIPFERDDMLELIGNLLDNAWKYASSTVYLKAYADGAQWCFEIEDDGKGIEASLFNEVNKRGVRVDELDNPEGYGLGLSICHSIADIYGGNVELFPSELGGLKVLVTLLRGK